MYFVKHYHGLGTVTRAFISASDAMRYKIINRGIVTYSPRVRIGQ